MSRSSITAITALTRLSMWVERFKGIRKLPTHALELGMATVALVIGFQFVNNPHLASSPFIVVFDRRLSHVWLGLTLFVSGLLAWIGYLDDNERLRMIGCKGQIAFWLYTGALLMPVYPHYYGPKLHISLGVLCAFSHVQVGVEYVAKFYDRLRDIKCIPQATFEGKVVPGKIIFRYR